MKAKDLIRELQKYEDQSEVAIYDHPSCGVLVIPGYDPEINVSTDPNFADEYDLPENTIFITGK